ncbi:MAG: multidrug efflux RND transporter permease subunit [Opitutales bacterium]|nr:multidrug efflux RND transporter permease subunit [Opitutales bacterium]
MARFFIDRPVFAWVLSLLIILLGGISLTQLPIAQYPTIAPPSISVTATYPGASSETVEKTVTTVIEQQISGVDNLLYMTSTSLSKGVSMIEVYFNTGTNPDIAQVQVQNKVSMALPMLPQVVQQTGVVVQKSSKNITAAVAIYDENDNMKRAEICNFVASQLLDPVRRIDGVGEVMFFGSENAMRIWLDAEKMNQYGLTGPDIVAAVSAQNTQLATGSFNADPAPEGTLITVSIQGPGTLNTPEEFKKILLKVSEDGSRVYLGDIADIEIGQQENSFSGFYNGHEAAGFAVKLATGANALKTVQAVKDFLKSHEQYFPVGVKAAFPYDTTVFVEASIHEVLKTLVEAIVLVFIVIYLFLQNIRATFIPTIVVPIALMGTVLALYAMGFTINVLTMFGMVLAIGILVDDAIVVIENVERIMKTEGLKAREATRKAMDQISGALIGITTVLTAVFIPMAFFAGSVGVIYRQFSLTLIASMLFSLFLAFTLTPALCAAILEVRASGKEIFWARWFNKCFNGMVHVYTAVVGKLIRHSWFGAGSFLLIAAGALWGYMILPTAFLPTEDQGAAVGMVQLPPLASQERTVGVIRDFDSFSVRQPEVTATMSIQGFSFNGQGTNVGLSFMKLADWSERQGEGQDAGSIANRVISQFGAYGKGLVLSFNLPPIPELGNAEGFELQFEDLSGNGHARLEEAFAYILQRANDPSSPMTQVRRQGLEDQAQFQMYVDREKAETLGVPTASLNNAIQVAMASVYVNNFVQGNRVQRVYVQLGGKDRDCVESVKQSYVRTIYGTMVPLAELVKFEWGFGSPARQKYNGNSSINIVGAPKPGHSTGECMKEIDRIISEELPKKGFSGFGYEWVGQSLQESESGNQAPILYALSFIIVFLCLSALYESWSIPFAVMLIVPVGILGSVAATMWAGLYNDVYFKVGFLVIIGLSAKNSILIIEFARDLQSHGRTLYDATIEAARLRLRPILMTSLAFILGVVPLATANGASSAAQNSIGVGVIGGMLAATIFGVFLIPCFFVVVRKIFKGKFDRKPNSVSNDASVAIRNTYNENNGF